MNTTMERSASPGMSRNRAAASDVDLDVLIVGTGLSGIGAAYHLHERCPSVRFTILEGRESIGGTWGLFRYPDIRPDSNMFMLGYSSRPWHSNKAISDGQTILDYIRDTAGVFDIDKSIRFRRKVTGVSWDSVAACWTVQALCCDGSREEPVLFTCKFLYMCSGYYDYEEGHTPTWPATDTFQGHIVHPQHWPNDLSCDGKRVMVIGSGATAVTLVPVMAGIAQHVAILQRSSTYIVSRPERDAVANTLRHQLPSGLAHRLMRTKDVLLTIHFHSLARRKPKAFKEFIIHMAGKQIGPGFDVCKHLTPRYNPWDQRLCLMPDDDLFKTIRTGKASITTDEITHFTPTGLQLKSGEHLDADVVVTATELKLKVLGGAAITVDGRAVNPAETVSYKGMMYSGMSNLASSSGYTSASRALKAESIAQYVCWLLNHMQSNGFDTYVPRLGDEAMSREPAVDLASGYIQHAAAILPKQNDRQPWKSYQNYVRDLMILKFGTLADSATQFERRAQPTGAAQPA